jgi:hypothetical protein
MQACSQAVTEVGGFPALVAAAVQEPHAVSALLLTHTTLPSEIVLHLRPRRPVLTRHGTALRSEDVLVCKGHAAVLAGSWGPRA